MAEYPKSSEPINSIERRIATTSPTVKVESYPGGWKEEPRDKYVSDTKNIYLQDPMAWDSGRNGPFNQTLFLGCSVTSFSTNLGWGGEASTCTVDLVEDTSYHWMNPFFKSNTERLRGQNKSAEFPSWQNDRRPNFTPDYNTVDQLTVVTGSIKEFRIPDSAMGDPTRNLSMLEEKMENKREQENIFLNELEPKRPDFGKVYYTLEKIKGTNNNFYTKKYWTAPDPGFAGEAYDILGCPTRFIFNEFEFCGLITSWKNTGGAGGLNKYTVEIKSFAGLLSNTSLIIDHYYGAIYKKFKTQAPAFATLAPFEFFGMPSNVLGDQMFRRNSSAYRNTTNNPKDYIGTISAGNIPNVFNIYGYIENAIGFGMSDTNEIGTKINDIWNGISDLINDGDAVISGGVKDDYWNYPRHIDKRFSPYGRLIGKTAALIKSETNSLSQNQNEDGNLYFLADAYRAVGIGGVDNEQYKRIKKTKFGTKLIGGVLVDKFREELENVIDPWTGLGIRMDDIGLLPNTKVVDDDQFRSTYRLDLSSLPVPPPLERIIGPVISIMDFVENICSNAGHRSFIDFVPPDIITIKTISENNQPPANYMNRMISSSVSQGGILGNYDYGKEFNDSATIRALYIGAHQKRLLQLNSSFLANKNNGLVFDPYGGWNVPGFDNFLMKHSLNETLNIARIPDHSRIRNPNFPYYTEQLFASVGGTGAMIWEEVLPNAFYPKPNSCGIGNYHSSLVYSGVNIDASDYRGKGVGYQLGNARGGSSENFRDIFKPLGTAYFNPSPNCYNTHYQNHLETPGRKVFPMKQISAVKDKTAQIVKQPDSQYYNYPLWDDFICPYFGLGLDGNARKVYYDTGMRQIQVLCHIGDLSNLLGMQLTKSIKDINLSNASKSNKPLVERPITIGPTVPGSISVSHNPPNISNDQGPGVSQQCIGEGFRDYGINYPEEILQSWSVEEKDREYHEPEALFLVTENEIRAAIAGFDSWMEYSFNKNFTTDLSQILRKTLFSNTGSIVTESTEQNNAVNMGLDSPVTMVTRGTTVFMLDNSTSENPSISPEAALIQKTREMLQKVHLYLSDNLGQFYGKQFMVKIPGLNITKDRTYIPIDLKDKEKKPIFSGKLQIQYGAYDGYAGSYDGVGKHYANYLPSTDGAWEEPGNFIDNTILLGTSNGNFFQEEDGKIKAILGYNASYEYLQPLFLEPTGVDAIGPESIENLVLTTMGFLNPSGFATNWASITGTDIQQSSAGLSASTLANHAHLTIEQIGGEKLLAELQKVDRTIDSHLLTIAKTCQPATDDPWVVPNDWYPSVITSAPDSDALYVKLPGNAYYWGEDIPSFSGPDELETKRTSLEQKPIDRSDLRFKLYLKGNVEPGFVFIKSQQLGEASKYGNGSSSVYRKDGLEARAIVTIPQAVNINPVHKVDRYLNSCLSLDAMLWRTEGCSIPKEISSETYKFTSLSWLGQKLASHSGTINDGLCPYTGGFGTHAPIVTLSTDHIFEEIHSAKNSEEDQNDNLPIAPKAAMPGFAGVPLECKGAVYGPWTNHPWLIRKEIFTSKDLKFDELSLKASVENLVGGLKVNVDTTLAPWNYGGMQILDESVIAKIQGDATYQLEIEQGTFELPGPPRYKIGDLLNKLSKNGGPVINSFRTHIDAAGMSTSYSFRTFSKKFGLYNKESSDRLAKINSESIKRRRELAVRSANITNRQATTITRQNVNGSPNANFTNPPIAAEWRSASNILVGHSEFSIRFPDTLQKDRQKDNKISPAIERLRYDFKWPSCPIYLGHPASGLYNNVIFPKFITHAKIMDSREIPSLLASDYEESSYMSLDGILSPISFYPTSNSRTFHITKYPRTQCKFCLGTGQIKYSTTLDGGLTAQILYNPNGIEDLRYSKVAGTKNQKVLDCPYCCLDIQKKKGLLSSSHSSRVNPPFLVTQIGDADIVSPKAGTEEELKTKISPSPRINYSTLNPAILAFGEFSAFQNRQLKDFTCHSIKMIGQGSVPPGNGAESLNQQGCNTDRLFKSCLEYDQIYLDAIHGLHEKDQAPPGTKKEQIKLMSNPHPKRFANNSRFFGLRGPLMLHSWGYDTEGYPVPNASGEIQFECEKDSDGFDRLGPEGLPKYVLRGEDLIPVEQLSNDKKSTRYIYKNQKWHKITPGEDVSAIPPSEIVKKGINGDGETGYWSAPYKEITFARGWAQLQSTWPVGPIDLRWDENARVWTTPGQYRNTYILLEEDLDGSNAARGEIIDNNQNIGGAMLPNGYRKTVFVKDNIGVYSAPRTAVVYCSYNAENGFYEPIAQTIANTSGLIISSNTAEFYHIYTTRNDTLASNAPLHAATIKNTYVGKYTNPLDLDLSYGSFAFFTYMNNGWVLQSTRGKK